jgi:hypothetical protein
VPFCPSTCNGCTYYKKKENTCNVCTYQPPSTYGTKYFSLCSQRPSLSRALPLSSLTVLEVFKNHSSTSKLEIFCPSFAQTIWRRSLSKVWSSFCRICGLGSGIDRCHIPNSLHHGLHWSMCEQFCACTRIQI